MLFFEFLSINNLIHILLGILVFGVIYYRIYNDTYVDNVALYAFMRAIIISIIVLIAGTFTLKAFIIIFVVYIIIGIPVIFVAGKLSNFFIYDTIIWYIITMITIEETVFFILKAIVK